MPSLKNSGFTTIEKSNSYVLLELFSIIFATTSAVPGITVDLITIV